VAGVVGDDDRRTPVVVAAVVKVIANLRVEVVLVRSARIAPTAIWVRVLPVVEGVRFGSGGDRDRRWRRGDGAHDAAGEEEQREAESDPFHRSSERECVSEPLYGIAYTSSMYAIRAGVGVPVTIERRTEQAIDSSVGE
jgi:hypothetical protein